MSTLYTLRVFCRAGDLGGNPLAVLLDAGEVPTHRRQAIAAELGLSETVFVDDAATGEMRIFTPTTELPFAGHPTVGTAWLLARERSPVAALRPPAGTVPVTYEPDGPFVVTRPEWAPDFDWRELASPAAVEALAGPPAGQDVLGAWAWLDEPAGIVRARVFPVRYGIDEDEATGAAAVHLCADLDRPIEIRQGRGSVIHARPEPQGQVAIGGRVALDERRERPDMVGT